MQINFNAYPSHLEHIVVKNENTKRLDYQAKSILDQKRGFDSSFLRQLSRQIRQTRVEVKRWHHPNNSSLSGQRIEEKHDVYKNHPESQYPQKKE